MYKINPDSYSSVFVLPSQIADKHLRMAGKAQLKVLLWLFRNPSDGGDIERISRDTGIPADEIDDAMLYWIEAGVIMNGKEMPKPAETAAVRTDETAEVEKREAIIREKPEKPKRIPVVKPTIKDIADRMARSEEIRNMFFEVQNIFGRTMGYDGQSSLLMLHDYYGLPAEVIVMLCGYAKTVGKHGSLNYIMKLGENWAENDINTFDLASRKIAKLEETEKLWNEIRRMTGIENPRPTSKQTEFLEIWLDEYKYGIDMIYVAYEKTVEKKGSISLSYMNGILRSWHEKGYKTPSDVESAEREFALKSADKHQKKQNESTAVNNDDTGPSYDIELAIRHSLMIDTEKTTKGQ